MQIVRDECWTGQFLLFPLEDCLSLGLGNFLQQAFDALGALIVPEAINYAAGSVVEQGLAVFFEVFVGIGSPIESFDVFTVEGKGCSGVLDNLVPIAECIVASGTVREEDGIWLAKDSFPVQLNGFVVAFITICLVASDFQPGCIFLALLKAVRAQH